jgi:hypothetical protein
VDRANEGEQNGGNRVAKEDVPKLTPGSRYRIRSMMTRDEPLVSEGVFKGYTMVGNMELEVEGPAEGPKGAEGKGKRSKKGKQTYLRLLPGQMIISIDILSQAEVKKSEDPIPSSGYYR